MEKEVVYAVFESRGGSLIKLFRDKEKAEKYCDYQNKTYNCKMGYIYFCEKQEIE